MQMSGKKLYAAILVFMGLLVGFGLWVMTDSIVAYRNQPSVESSATKPQVQAHWLDDDWKGACG